MNGAAFGLNRTNVTSLTRCPDCLSETQLVEIDPNVIVAQVLHDDTCPFLRRREARR